MTGVAPVVLELGRKKETIARLQQEGLRLDAVFELPAYTEDEFVAGVIGVQG